MPPEEEVDRFRYKKDEEIPLPILTSSCRGVTVTKYDITTLRREGIVVYNDNDPDPEIVVRYKSSLPSPETLNFGFQGIDPWCQSGNLPFGKSKLNMVSNISVQHMSCLDFF